MQHSPSGVRDRLDRILVNRGLVTSREEAGRLILAGMVRVDGCVVDKQAKLISSGADVQIVRRLSQYVSRGGDKLGPA